MSSQESHNLSYEPRFLDFDSVGVTTFVESIQRNKHDSSGVAH